MNKFKLVLFCALILITSLCVASVNSSVDSTNIYIDEPFQLTITSDQPGKPDVAPLLKNFNILGQSSGHSMSYINGDLSRSYQYRYSLTVKYNKIDLSKGSSGIILPSVSISNKKTRAIQLTIQKPMNTIKDNNRIKSKIEISITPEKSFVQQEITLNIDIYLDESIAGLVQSMAISPIVIPNTTIMEFKEPIIYKKNIDGKPVVIIVKKLALFPQNSGEIIIPPITFSASILDEGNNQHQYARFNSPFYPRTKTIRVTSEPKKIQIKPMPISIKGTWLPTTMLKAEGHFDPVQKNYRVGEIITRTITIEADNLLAAQLPEIKPKEINNVKIYTDTPELQDFENKGIIHSQRIETFTYVPTKKGNIIIPKISFEWYDINSKETRTIILPPRTITVLPAINTINNVSINTPNKETTVRPEIITKRKDSSLNSYSIIIIILFFILFSYIIIYFYLKTKLVKLHKQSLLDPKKISIKAALYILEQKLMESNPKEIKHAYTDFLNNIINKEVTLNDITTNYSDDTKKLLSDLDQSIYGNKNIKIDGVKLFSFIKKDMKLNLKNKQKKEKSPKDELPNLYPD
ncbi:MAG: hypothetical protein ACJA0H_000468 [Francisellaceae bacterium]|jgi:hypothetical protein